MPFVTNGVYWVTLKFDTWRHNKKQVITGKRLLSIEESNQLRKELLLNEEKVLNAVEMKDREIESLKSIIKEIETRDSKLGVPEPILAALEPDFSDEYDAISKKGIFRSNVKGISSYINGGWAFDSRHIPADAVSFFVANNLIEKSENNKYSFTKKGIYFLKRFLDEEVR